MCKIFGLLLLAALSQAQPRSYYGRAYGLNSAEDLFGNGCDKSCQPLVVRPQTVPKPPPAIITVPAPPLQVPLPSIPPVGGPCYCRRPVVKPAVIPKPPCRSFLRRRVSNSNSCSYNNENNQEVYETLLDPLAGQVEGCTGNVFGPLNNGLYPAGSPVLPPGALGYGLYSPGANGPYGAGLSDTREQLKAADPVSVSIAYSLAQKAQNLKEDVLSFGFRQLPKEVPALPKPTRNIPEENLYSLNGAIVELKPVQSLAKSVDEEAAEQLLDLQEEENNVGESGVRKLSFGELGYGLAKVAPTATYVDVPPIVPALEAGLCKDPNYVPGSVTINRIPKYETVELPTDSGLNSYITESQSSSSRRSSQASKVLLERLECGCGTL